MDRGQSRRSGGIERSPRPAVAIPAGLEARFRALRAAGDTKQAATEVIRGYGPVLLRYLRGLLGAPSRYGSPPPTR
jgi:hypothetical protein